MKMIEKVYSFKDADEKLIEKIVNDDNIALNHMILTEGTSLPEHYSNSNVYMIVVKGCMTLKLNEQNPREYKKGSIINIPYNTKMNVGNLSSEKLEFFVVKAPSPANYR